MVGYLAPPKETAAVLQAEACPRHAALTQAALDRAQTGLIGLDTDLRVVLCNRAAVEMLGMPSSKPWRSMPIDRMLTESTALGETGRVAFETALRTDTMVTSGLSDRLTSIALISGSLLNVAVHQTAEGHWLAALTLQTAGVPKERTDGLTGLSDRHWFRERVANLLTAPDKAEQVAVLMIDLDRFKAVNDSHGHPVGDALLQLVAQRLRSAVREGDVVSRLGGDEFAIAMPAPADAEALGIRLVELLGRSYLVEGHVAIIGASIGIAVGPRDGTDTATLIRAADLALYQAKEDGRQTVRVFDQAMSNRARARHVLLDDLRSALMLQQFEVHYQPQINLASGRLIGFEALVRWRHPEHGLVPPDRFIPLAEEMGLIVPIGEWVLRTACRDAMSWPGEPVIAVNVSAKQLADRDRLPRVVKMALAATGLPARRLELEITESAMVRYEKEALHVLHALRATGVRVSMDDFGTGYSSLSQLRSFPFDKLKIDRSFVRDIADGNDAAAVVRAIAALGASMRMTVTAEGVETAEQEAMVRADGCTDMQGYLVSRPVPAEDVAGLIERLGVASTPPLEGSS